MTEPRTGYCECGCGGRTRLATTTHLARGLPPLVATEDVRDVMATLPKSVTDRIHRASPGPDRWKLRSTTFTGLGVAMAVQWGGQVFMEQAS